MHATATAWAGARRQTPEEPRPTEASGRAWSRTTPPTAAQTSPPPFRAQPSGRPPQGAAQDPPRRGARKPLHGKGEQRSCKAGVRSHFRRRFREEEVSSA